MGVIKAVANFLESPVIMILHASTALSRQASSRRALWSFMLKLALGVTVVFAFLAVPPVYKALMQSVFGLGGREIEVGQPAFLMMIVWPAAIAWRRYFQGLLIGGGQGRFLSYASLTRLGLVSILLLMGVWMGTSGALVAASALVGGILVEAMSVTFLAHRSGVTREPTSLPRDPSLPATENAVWHFYRPLAQTMLITWGARAVLVSFIGHSFDSVQAVAAWSAGWGFVLLVANSTRMLQQLVIVNYGKIGTSLLLRAALVAGLACSTLLAIFAFHPAGVALLGTLLGTGSTLLPKMLPVIQLGCLLPILIAIQNGLQGFAIARGQSKWVNQATFLGTSIMLLASAGLIAMDYPGAWAGAASMLFGIALDISLLLFLLTRE
jgi:hypothetical protein